MNRATVLFIVALAASGAAEEVLDLGDIGRYSPRSDVNPPDLSGNSMWLSGSEADGYDVALSADTQAKVHGILEGCGTTDDRCYQEIRQLLRSTDLQIDGQVERRGFVDLLSKTFKKVGSVFSFMAGALIAHWAMGQQQPPNGLFVPIEIASQASKLTEATGVVISVGGSAVLTVTPTPDPTALQGSETPSVTPVTEPVDKFEEGDLIAVLDPALASRIDEVMHRSQQCDDGDAFDRGDKVRRKRADVRYGKAICAAEAAAIMAQKGGPFNDLLLLNTAHVSFDFADAAGAVTRAANVASDFVRSYAPMLDIDPDLAEQLGNFLFALAVNTLVESAPLGRENRIPASNVVTEEPSPTATACPDPETSPLVCGFSKEDDDCDLKKPDNLYEETTCKSGQYKGCDCNAPSFFFENIASDEEQKSMLFIPELFRAIVPKPKAPECSHADLSVIPSNVFGSPQNNVYHEFCKNWKKDAKLEMTVNAAGENVRPQPQMFKSVQSRTPPPNPNNWSKYDFHLSFTPASEGTECTVDCEEAFSQFTRACRNTGSVGTVMAQTGKHDVGCGVFDYSIETNTAPLEINNRECFPADGFHGDHGEALDQWVNNLSVWSCASSGEKAIKRGDESTFHHLPTGGEDVVNFKVDFSIYWKEGCSLDNADEVTALNPLLLDSPGEFSDGMQRCEAFYRESFQNCAAGNGGAGGLIQAGCLVYQVKVSDA